MPGHESLDTSAAVSNLKTAVPFGTCQIIMSFASISKYPADLKSASVFAAFEASPAESATDPRGAGVTDGVGE